MKKYISIFLVLLFTTLTVAMAEAGPRQPWRKQQNKINRQGVKQFKKNARQNRRAMITWEEVCHA